VQDLGLAPRRARQLGAGLDALHGGDVAQRPGIELNALLGTALVTGDDQQRGPRRQRPRQLGVVAHALAGKHRRQRRAVQHDAFIQHALAQQRIDRPQQAGGIAGLQEPQLLPARQDLRLGHGPGHEPHRALRGGDQAEIIDGARAPGIHQVGLERVQRAGATGRAGAEVLARA
jgi:hypothetical protein